VAATFATPQAKIGGALLLACLLLAVVGVLWNPDATDITADLRQGPSLDHPLGTDDLGRDVLLRVVAGSYRIIAVSAATAIVSMALGSLIAAFVAYRGGLLDLVTMRIIDLVLSFPMILVALLVAATLPSGYLSIFLLVVAVTVPAIIRITRTIFAEVFTRDYVTAAVLRGDSFASVVVREALPNAAGPLLVEFALRWNYSVILIASLNFLGVGVRPPTPDWGVMIFEARGDLLVAPWAAVAPAVALAALAVAINFTADALSAAVAHRSDVAGDLP
jgi:peptide/nickel transport system permease protein